MSQARWHAYMFGLFCFVSELYIPSGSATHVSTLRNWVAFEIISGNLAQAIYGLCMWLIVFN